MRDEISVQGEDTMNHLLIIAILLTVAMPAHAGFKFYGPGGQTMNSTETEEERADRLAQDQERAVQAQQRAEMDRAWADELRRSNEHNERMNAMYRSQNPVDPMFFTCPPPRNKYNDGPRPGGHQRHEWRERTGFNTPAERTRYKNEIRRLNRELKKEKARPNPGGAHPEEIRKQHMPKF